MKKSRSNRLKKWWSKHGTVVIPAIIGGVLAIISNVLGISLPAMIAHFTEKLDVSIDMAFLDFNFVPGLYAEDPINFPQDSFVIVTNSCIKGYSESTEFFGTKPSATDKLETVAEISIQTNMPILIKQLALNIRSIKTVNPDAFSLYYFDAGLGGGSALQKIYLDPIEIIQVPRKYDLLKAEQYQLPANDAMGFIIPMSFTKSGIYEYQFTALVEAYDGKSIQIATDTFKEKWLYIPEIDPARIQINLEDVTDGSAEFYQKAKFTSCP